MSSFDELAASAAEEETKSEIKTTESGIPGFDDALGGGLPIGNLFLFSGVFGNNQPLFAQQILYHSIVEKGKVVYYSLDQASTDIIDEMAKKPL